MINGWLFSVLVFALIALSVCLLFTLYAIITGKDDPLLTVPHYLQERFQSFFEEGVVKGVLKSLYFIACLAIVPFVLTLYCVSLFAKMYTITYEDGSPVRTWYTTVGKQVVHDGEAVAVDRKMVYIFNDTDKTFCLCSTQYSSSVFYDRDDPEFFLISPHAFIETGHDPDFWFDHPEMISVKVSKTETHKKTTVTRWLVMLVDSDTVDQ